MGFWINSSFALERKCIMERDQQPKTVDRQKRVARLKKMIILSIVIGIVVPWVACTALFVYVLHLGSEERELYKRLRELTEAAATWNAHLEDLKNLFDGELSKEKALNEELTQRIKA